MIVMKICLVVVVVVIVIVMYERILNTVMMFGFFEQVSESR